MLYEGNFEELLRPPEDQQHMQMRREGDYDAKAHFDQCIRAARLTGVAEAARHLTSEGSVVATEEVLGKLKEALGPQPALPVIKEEWQATKKDIKPLRAEDLLATCWGLRWGKAQDLSGWCAEHVQVLLPEPVVAECLHKWLNRIWISDCSASLTKYLSFVKGVALKNGTKVRPIAVGSIFRKVTMGTWTRLNREKLGAYCGTRQFALNHKCAIENMSQSVQRHMWLHPHKCIIQLDAISAFNRMSRATMLENIFKATGADVWAFIPYLAQPSTMVLLDGAGKPKLLQTTQGVEQGNPGSPFAYSAGMVEVNKRIQELTGFPVDPGAL